MQRLTANLAGRALRQRWGDREYLVAPVSMMVPGVLRGSRGPLFYPPDVVSRDVQNWDLQPLTLGHPTGSAHEAGVFDRQGLGVVRNVRFSGGKLRADAWFDAERTRRIAPNVYNQLLRGEPIEVSTGLYTRERPAPAGATFNGREYSHVVYDFTPDHLAILPDQTGACSVRDGCGTFNEESDMLTHNCNCRTDNAEGLEAGLPMPSTATAEPTINVEQSSEHFGVLPLPSTASPRVVQNKTGARSQRLDQAKRQLAQAVRGVGSIGEDGGMEVSGHI